MKILQKIFSVILFLIFITSSIGITNAIQIETTSIIDCSDKVVDSVTGSCVNDYKNTLKRELIISKQKLAKIPKGNKYISKIDKLIKNIGTNKDKLQKLQTKLYELETKLYAKDTKEPTKYKKYFTLIDYIHAKINLELYNLEQVELEASASRVETKLSEMRNPNLSEADRKKVEEKLVNIQLNLLNSANSNFKSLLSDFEKLSNYEEKGNLKMKFNLDHELVGKIKSEIELQDYKTKASGFDSQFSGKLKALVEASIKGEEDFKLEFSTFMDFISKDGNMYVLLNKLNIVDESNDRKIKEALETLKKLATKNKYIKFEDRETKQILQTLKSINPSKIFADSKAILEKPLFTAYKKEADKYSLIPTKYACDKFKELSAKFDPWNGNTCSDSQYEGMLEELADSGDLYIEIGKENKLGFDAYPQHGVLSFNSYIIFDDINVTKIHSQLVAREENEGFELSYIKNNKLAFYLNAGDDVKVDFKSILDNHNKFKSIDFVYNAKGYRDEFNAKLKLENKKLNGGFEYNYTSYAGYDSETYESKYNKQNLSMSLSGRQDPRNVLQDLKINIKGTNLDTKQKTFSAELNKQAKNYYAIIEAYDEGQTVFKSNLKLKNSKINGETIVYKNGKEYVKIFSTGKYDTKFLDLNNKIELAENPLTASYDRASSRAKDSGRKADLNYLKMALEMYYSDIGEYPNKLKGNEDFEIYLNGYIPKNPSGNIEINGCKFGYYYEVGTGGNGIENEIENEEYRLSSCMENGEKYITGTATKYFKADKEFYINGYTTWTKKEIKEEEKPKVQADINIEVDTRYNRNNLNFYIDYIEGDKKILEIEVDNKGKINYKKVNIETPTDTMEIDEALDIKY